MKPSGWKLWMSRLLNFRARGMVLATQKACSEGYDLIPGPPSSWAWLANLLEDVTGQPLVEQVAR
jgi:hypothetical protein